MSRESNGDEKTQTCIRRAQAKTLRIDRICAYARRRVHLAIEFAWAGVHAHLHTCTHFLLSPRSEAVCPPAAPLQP